MTITIEQFGPDTTQPADRIRITNSRGSHIALTPAGARLIEVHVPDRDGRLDDVVLGFDSVEDYLASETYAGSIAGRYANRIAGAQFVLDGEPVQVEANEGRNHVHGGFDGLDRQLWHYEPDEQRNGVTFTHSSPDGHGGYPAAVDITVSYRLQDDDVLVIDIAATASAPTVLNLVNHAYWNLAGHASGSVLEQTLQVSASTYVPVDAELLATGEIRSVHGTPFDFTTAHPIGDRIADVPTPAGRTAGATSTSPASTGYDHNWVLDGPRYELHPAVLAADPRSGRRLRLSTTEPGVQIYTGGYLDGLAGKDGATYDAFAGFTLETQTFPGSPNHAWFPSARVDPDHPYRHLMVLAFDALG